MDFLFIQLAIFLKKICVSLQFMYLLIRLDLYFLLEPCILVFFSSSFSAIFGLSESVSVFYFIPITSFLAILFCIYVSSGCFRDYKCVLTNHTFLWIILCYFLNNLRILQHINECCHVFNLHILYCIYQFITFSPLLVFFIPYCVSELSSGFISFQPKSLLACLWLYIYKRRIILGFDWQEMSFIFEFLNCN